MSKPDYDPTKDPYEIARRAQIIKRVFSPNAPLVRTVKVIKVSMTAGDGSSDTPTRSKDFYYTIDGELIGER